MSTVARATPKSNFKARHAPRRRPRPLPRPAPGRRSLAVHDRAVPAARVGSGVPLVAPTARRQPLTLKSSRVFAATGTVLLTYEAAAAARA
jgi:hypothetical protein